MSKRKWMSIGFLVSCLGILVIPFAFVPQVHAQGGTIILNPIDDAYTDGDLPKANFGSELILKASLRYFTWLKFDLSAIPEGAFGISALLELYTSYGGVTSPRDVVACLILNNFNNSWSEDTITATNAPPYPAAVELDTDYVGNNETWYEWVVTEAVVNATANNANAVTIIMRHPWGQWTPPMSFVSKEASSTKIPKLTVTWTSVNQRPIAVLDVDKINPDANETVTFDASSSTDDGQIDYYFFDFGDGTNSGWTPLSIVTHEYDSEDTFIATLVVMDDLGVTSTNLSNSSILVSTHVNEVPVAVLTVNKTNPEINEFVTFSALDSYDSDGQVELYFFDFGDGSDSGWISLPVLARSYTEPGVFNVTVLVKDNMGATSTNSEMIKIEMTVVPEFPSFLILPLFMITTLATIVYVKKRKASQWRALIPISKRLK